MKMITEVATLVEALNKAEKKEEYQSILDRTNIDHNAWSSFIHWSDAHYTRNCISETENYQLILLCWNKGQHTMIHDHDGQAGWIKVIEGSVVEDLYAYPLPHETPKFIRSAQCKVGDVAHITDEIGLHRISNAFKDKVSITLHLYVKPIHTAKLFQEDGTVITKEPKYFSVQGELVGS